MTKAEMKKAANHELITAYVSAYGHYCSNLNTGGGIKALAKNLTNFEAELLSRGILTEADLRHLNS